MGVLTVRALLFGIHIRAPAFWKASHGAPSVSLPLTNITVISVSSYYKGLHRKTGNLQNHRVVVEGKGPTINLMRTVGFCIGN